MPLTRLRTTRAMLGAVALLVATLLTQAQTSPTRSTDEIVVMTSGAFTAAHLELAPGFERTTRNTVVTAATSMGSGVDSIPSRLQRRQPVDVVILAGDALDSLITQNLVLAGSRVDLARSGIGMAVRAGARKPDISTSDALRKTLLEATSVAYSASVSGDYLVQELFPKLGIAAEMTRKGRRIQGERVGAVVARGDAEIGFQQISELLPISGIDYVGPLPPDVQLVSVFAAGVVSHSKRPEAARAYIRYLSSPAVAATVSKTGLDPIR